MKTINTIKSLNISLDELYNGTKQLVISLNDKPHQFHVVLKDRTGTPDCKISSFTANLWARTNKGVNYEKYKSIATLQSSLIKLVNSKIETNGPIKFSLSDDIMTI
jgi:hypothetical protein